MIRPKKPSATLMPEPRPIRPQFRTLVHAVGRRAFVGAIAGTLCLGPCGAANDDEEKKRLPHHPFLAPALSLVEMASGGPVERAMERSARVLFPELAKGTLPATDFGALVLPSFWGSSVVLFREAGGETLVEVREREHGIRLRDLTSEETPTIGTKSKSLRPEIATASVSAIRRALSNTQRYRPGSMVVLDGVSYYFFSGDRVGSAHSPDSATEAGKLVRLVRVLEQFVDGEVAERELRMAAEDALRANHGMTKDR